MRRFAHKYPLDERDKEEIEKKYAVLQIDIKGMREDVRNLSYDEIWRKLEKLVDGGERRSDIDMHIFHSQDYDLPDFFENPFDMFSFMTKSKTEETVESFITRLFYCIGLTSNYYEDIKYFYNYTIRCNELYNKKVRIDDLPKGLGKARLDGTYCFPVEFNINRTGESNKGVERPMFCQYYQSAFLEDPVIGVGIFKKSDQKEYKRGEERSGSAYIKKYLYDRIKKALLEQECLSKVPLTYSDVWLIENTIGFNLVMTLFEAIVDEKDLDQLYRMEPVIKEILKIKGIKMRVEIAARIVDFLKRRYSFNNQCVFPSLDEDLKKIRESLNDTSPKNRNISLVISQNEKFDLLAEGMLYLIERLYSEQELFAYGNRPEIVFIRKDKVEEIEKKVGGLKNKNENKFLLDAAACVNINGEIVCFEDKGKSDGVPKSVDKSAGGVDSAVKTRINSAKPSSQYANLQEFVLQELFELNGK